MALLAALVLLAVVARPAPQPAPTAAPSPAAATRSPAPTLAVGVPAACAGDVSGEVFSTGSLEQRLAALDRYAAAGAGRQASLVFTDATLTEPLRAQLAAPGAPPFVDPALQIRPDGVRVTGAVTAAFLRFPVSATLVPEVQGGALRFVVRQLETGSLPGQFRDQVSQAIAQAADPAAWRLRLRVSDAVLRSGCGVVRGTTTL